MTVKLAYNATLIERLDLSPTLAMFRVQPDEPPAAERPWFEPGQYTAIGLNVDDAGAVQRTFSMASAPEDRRWLEFYIRRNPEPHTEQPFTHLLWQLGPGAQLHIGPRAAGRFTVLHTVGAADPRIKLMIGGGTGVAPFVSLVRSRVLRAADIGDLVLLHGASYPQELAYLDEIAAKDEILRHIIDIGWFDQWLQCARRHAIKIAHDAVVQSDQ